MPGLKDLRRLLVCPSVPAGDLTVLKEMRLRMITVVRLADPLLAEAWMGKESSYDQL
jgi:hypothetical protein